MSKERSISIPVPSDTHKSGSFSALTGKFRDGKTIFSFAGVEGSPFGNTNAEPQSRPAFQPPSIRELIEEEEIAELQDIFGAKWEFHVPITEEATEDDKQELKPESVPVPEPTRIGVIIDSKRIPTLEDVQVAATPTVHKPDNLRFISGLQGEIPTPHQIQPEIVDGPIVPPNEYGALIGIGILGTAAAIGVVAKRNEIRRYKREKINPKLEKMSDDTRMGIYSTLFDVERVIEAISGRYQFRAVNAAMRHVQRNPRYEGVGVSWTTDDKISLIELARGTTHPSRQVRRAFTLVRALKLIGKEVDPSTILYLLNSEHTAAENPHEIEIGRDPEGGIVLYAEGYRYAAHKTSDEIINHMAEVRASRTSLSKLSLYERLKSLVIEPTVI